RQNDRAAEQLRNQRKRPHGRDCGCTWRANSLTMDDMREIVTVEQVNSLFLGLAIGLPVVGLIGGYLFGRRAGAIKGFIVGLFGPLNLLLWKMYNLITDKLGLDSVKNLLVQLGLFIALGIAGGLLFRRFV